MGVKSLENPTSSTWKGIQELSSEAFRRSLVMPPWGCCGRGMRLCGCRAHNQHRHGAEETSQRMLAALPHFPSKHTCKSSSVILPSRRAWRSLLYLQDAWAPFSPPQPWNVAPWLIACSQRVPIQLYKWFAGIFWKRHAPINLEMIAAHAGLWGLVFTNL